MLGEEFENSKAHETGRHRHDGNPSRLQSKIDIGSADNCADTETSCDSPDREAATGGQRGRSHDGDDDRDKAGDGRRSETQQ